MRWISNEASRVFVGAFAAALGGGPPGGVGFTFALAPVGGSNASCISSCRLLERDLIENLGASMAFSSGDEGKAEQGAAVPAFQALDHFPHPS
eukprot:CAMPEP_0181409236 /NCGR_PEP_ID=MMETSP1110-20121109/6714_1 /TAXON_ID=174948 /ORGANISM="Symbiodinium sp., Strain CCMP421" /LENGTH=92 /DNA_ID=CAMNT_0023531735 /DNA_START=808 /DNA_END=1090 /DNA_ORIENTATION=+